MGSARPTIPPSTRRGIPVLHFFTDLHEDYHRATDDADKVSAAGVGRVVSMAERVVRAIGDRDARLTPVRVTRPAPVATGGRGRDVYLGSIPDMSAAETPGVRLTGVRADSPAERAGLKAGDVIVEFDGKPVKDLYQYTDALQARKPGDTVPIVVLREGSRITLTATLGRKGWVRPRPRPVHLRVLLVLAAFPAGAQTPKRPKLEANADTNDWEAYYEYGARYFQQFPGRAYDAFYWAARLAPWSADRFSPNGSRFTCGTSRASSDTWRTTRKCWRRPMCSGPTRSHDWPSCATPSFTAAMEMAIYDALPGWWGGDVLSRAWIAYANQKLDNALELFGRAISENPDKFYRLRHIWRGPLRRDAAVR